MDAMAKSVGAFFLEVAKYAAPSRSRCDGKLPPHEKNSPRLPSMHCEAIHCADTRTVRFAIYPDGLDGPRIIAHISEAALRDLSETPDGDLTQTCETNFGCIEAKAVERYRAAPSAPIILSAIDLSSSALLH